MIKKVTALCCAFAVSFAGFPETNVNAQTTKVQAEIEQTDDTITKQGIVHTLATKSVSKESELTAAINSCAAGGAVIINLTSSFKITKGISISGNKTVYINGTNGSNRRVIGTNEEILRLFVVEQGSSLIFNDMILKGGTSSATDISYRTTTAIVVADGGNIQLNNCKVMYSQAALVNIKSNGTVIAKDTTFSDALGTINDCGGAVRISSGTFTMEGNSEITNNNYGGVYISSTGTFTMNGGRIYGNKRGAGSVSGTVNYGMGGGVFCNGTFNFIGGTIDSNSVLLVGNGVVISSTGNMRVDSGANLVNTGDKANELLSYTSNMTFTNAPVVPMNTKLGFSVSIGQEIAKCSQNVSAESCMKIDGFIIRNNPVNPSSIIGSGDYVITYESGGAIGKDTITTIGAYNSSFHLPTEDDYKKIGYRLIGWSGNPDGNIYSPGSSQTVSSNVTYYPVWQAKDIGVEYYDMNGNKLGITGSYNYDNQSAYTIQSAEKIKGYNFLYWQDISEDAPAGQQYQENTALSRTEQDSTLKLKAVYEEKNITVKFNVNNTEAKMSGNSTITVKYNEERSLDSYTPTTTGYKFAGWYTDKECVGNKLASVSPAKLGVETTIELYAKWDAMDVPVTYDTAVQNGKSTVKYDSKLTIPIAASKTGYTFKGWYLNGDKSRVYLYGEEICPKTLGITSINLSAIFEKNLDVTISPGSTPTPTSSSTGSTTTTGGTTTTTNSSNTSSTSSTGNQSTSSNTNATLTLSVSKKTIGVGDKFRITIKSNDTYSVSSNSSIIKVDNQGYVTAVKSGTAVVTVKTANLSKTCTVTVKKAPAAANISVKAKRVKKGKTISVKPTFTKSTYCMSVTYSSANKKIATVSKRGKVKGLKKGTAKITIKCSTGAKKVIKIKVV